MHYHAITFPGQCPQFLATRDIYYLEPEYNEPYHVYIREHFGELSEILQTKNRSLIYYAQKPVADILSYNYPGEYWATTSEKNFTVDLTRKLFAHLGVLCPDKPMLLTGLNDFKKGNGKVICIFPDTPQELPCILKRAEECLVLNSIDFEAFLEATKEHPDADADRDFAKIAYRLTQEIEDNIEILRLYGCDKLLQQILDAHPSKPSRMNITEDYRIFLPDYGNMEIKMTPLVKAVYFLFMDYPQGIMFRNLDSFEYVRKLNFIYKTLARKSDYKQIQDSITQIMNCKSNSINEKCSRIREAFVSKFTDDLAAKYYITGYRGLSKKIELDRKLITWQGHPYDFDLWNRRMQYGKDHNAMITFERREQALNEGILESLKDLSDIFK